MADYSRVVKMIADFKAKNSGRTPTYTEMLTALKIKSRGHLHYILKKLQDAGALERLEDGTISLAGEHIEYTPPSSEGDSRV